MRNSAQHLFVADTKVVTVVTDSAICRPKKQQFPSKFTNTFTANL